MLAKHRQDDPIKLALKRFDELPARILSLQVEARQKHAKKLPSWVINDALYFPLNLNQEQASSEITALFKTSQWAWFQLNKSAFSQVIDLTAGMGVDSWAFAKAGLSVQAYELDPTLAAITSYNLINLGLDVDVINGSFADFDRLTEGTLVYIDPDRRPGNKREFGLAESVPNVIELLPKLLARQATVMIKASPMLDLKLALSQLGHVTQVLAISWRGDCRELVLVCEPSEPTKVTYTAVEIAASQQIKQFSIQAPSQTPLTKPALIATALGKYIYHPGPSVNKLHLADELAASLNLGKLHPATWLYTGSELHLDYPGRVFELLEVCKADSDALHQAIRRFDPATGAKPKVHLMALNLPTSSEQMAKQLKVQEGGSLQVFVATLANGLHERQVAALVCRQV